MGSRGAEGEAGRAGPTVISTGTAQIGGSFTLVDETGAVVTEAEFEGQPTLVCFGFSYCPDVCPTSLQKLGAAQERMGEAAEASWKTSFLPAPVLQKRLAKSSRNSTAS